MMPPARAPPSATTWYAAHESERGEREREREQASKKNGDELALAHFLRRSEATEARGEWSGGTGNDWVSWDAVGVAGMHSKAEGRAHTASCTRYALTHPSLFAGALKPLH